MKQKVIYFITKFTAILFLNQLSWNIVHLNVFYQFTQNLCPLNNIIYILTSSKLFPLQILQNKKNISLVILLLVLNSKVIPGDEFISI